ncbi:MAG: hypothetical protein A2Z34_00095 [Planctomycetes bacterium RBG_16_59_8]|nr:MAG: hypothetical protein A2Z34_00095 [Planctomycetes bacterium RBG_16_59_8]
MRFGVDTNILLYAVNRDCPEHATARALVEDWIRERVPFCIAWNVIYEFIRVGTHRAVFPRPLTSEQALRFLLSILEAPSVHVLTETDRHLALLKKTLSELVHPSGNLLHDVHTAVLLREHGVPEIVTADADFLQFKFLKVVDPVHAVKKQGGVNS